MQRLIEIVDLFKSGATLGNFPYAKKRNKYTVLFVCPTLTSEGFYRMLVPFFALNEHHKDIRCLLSTVEEYNPNQHVSELNLKLRDDYVIQSDMVVFPFINYDLSPIFDKIRKINPKAKIAYHVDHDIFTIPKDHPFKHLFSEDSHREAIIRNISNADSALFPNKALNDHLFAKLHGKISGCNTNFHTFPLIWHPELAMEACMKVEEKAERDIEKKIRIGIVANNHHFQDMKEFGSVIKAVKKELPQVEFVSFGFDGSNPHDETNAFSKLEITYEPPVSFFNYYEKLLKLNLDFAWIPSMKSPFNTTSRNVYKVFEFAVCAIPTFVPEQFPFNKIVDHNSTGVRIKNTDDWLKVLKETLNHWKEVKESDGGVMHDRYAKITLGAIEKYSERYSAEAPHNIQAMANCYLYGKK